MLSLVLPYSYGHGPVLVLLTVRRRLGWVDLHMHTCFQLVFERGD